MNTLLIAFILFKIIITNTVTSLTDNNFH